MTILVAVLFGLNGWAQLDIGMRNEQPQVPSWESYELAKYGSVGASMYTGTVSYAIPFYTYSDMDFEIPISINYSTNGLVVNHASGNLGLGWSLCASGSISRQIRGLPDEVTKQLELSPYAFTYKGYSMLSPEVEYEYGITYTLERPYATKFSESIADGGQVEHVDYNETEADIYRFSFGHYTGSFMRNTNNKTVDGSMFHVFSTTGETIGLRIEAETSASGGGFVITDTQGYVYHFSCSEFTEQKESVPGSLGTRIVTGWSLDTITAPNGRKIVFNYSSLPLNVNEPDKEYRYYPAINHYFASCAGITLPTETNVATVQSSWVCKSRLTGIEFGDDIRMRFIYSPGKGEYYKDDGGTVRKANCDSMRLTGIKLERDGAIVKNMRLSYVTNCASTENFTGNVVTFLNNVEISGEGAYTFEYNGQDGVYPYLGTNAYDHWGYHNSAGFPLTGFRHCIAYDDSLNESTTHVKDPSFSASAMGTLRRIVYPTGGFSTLEYEPHTYSRSVERHSTTGGSNPSEAYFHPLLQIQPENKECGGVRISRIISTSQDAAHNDTTSYDYTLPSGGSMSSGILTASPRYGIEYSSLDSMKHVEFYDLSNSMYDSEKTHIEYSDVTVHRSESGSTRYHYSTSADFPDIVYGEYNKDDRTQVETIGLASSSLNGASSSRIFNAGLLVESALTPVSSMQSLRGKLLCETFLSSSGQVLKETSRSYKQHLVAIDTIYFIAGEIAKPVMYPHYNTSLSSVVTKEYSDVMLSAGEFYSYNRIGLPVRVACTTSLGDTVVTMNTYVFDTVNIDPVINDMKNSHMHGKLLATETHRIHGDIDNLLSATRLTYYKPDANKRLTCPSMKEEFTPGQGWKTVESYLFDTMGNLVEVTDEGQLTSSYLWSYGNRHLVSTLRNATMAQTTSAMATVGLGTPGQLAGTASVSAEDYRHLGQLGTQLPASLQDSWQYKPLVGMTVSTPPNHSSGIYHYDGYGRLTEMCDGMGNVRQEQEYNIVTVSPVSSAMHCDTMVSVEDTIHATITATGGSGIYDFSWHISDTSGSVTYTLGEGQSQAIVPLSAGLSHGSYILTCVVTDRMTAETSVTHHHVLIRPMRIQFSNVTTSDDFSGNKTVSATIISDEPVEVTFNLSYVTTGQCVLRIGGFSQNYTGHAEDLAIVRQLAQGANTVSITLTDSAIAQAQLTITQAGEHPVGNEKTLTIEF